MTLPLAPFPSPLLSSTLPQSSQVHPCNESLPRKGNRTWTARARVHADSAPARGPGHPVLGQHHRPHTSPRLAKGRRRGLPCCGQCSNTTSAKVLPGMLLQSQLSGSLQAVGHTKPAKALLYYYLVITITLWAQGLKPHLTNARLTFCPNTVISSVTVVIFIIVTVVFWFSEINSLLLQNHLKFPM